MSVLLLRGTTFLGRHLARSLRARGHHVSLFTRGRSAYDDDVEATRYVGDRRVDLRTLPRDGWDAIVDTSGYVPAVVAASCAHLATAGRYLFVSSMSVYAMQSDVLGDGYAPFVSTNPAVPDDDDENYGSSKRRSEEVVTAVFRNRA